MNRAHQSLPRRQAGFSLVELMIALTIGFMIIAGVGYLYLGSREAFRTQDSLTTIQENARFALQTMSHDIRMAGYMGCGNLSNITPNIIASAISPLSPATALVVFPGGAGWTAPASITRKSGTDVLRVSRASGGNVTAYTPASSMSGTPPKPSAVQINANPNNFIQKNDVVLISNCQTADVFAVTNNVTGGSSLSFGIAGGLNTYNKLANVYNQTAVPPAQVYKFYQTDYFIGCPTASYSGGTCSVPWALYQSVNGVPTALVDNVENVAYWLGVDTSGTSPPAGVVGAYQSPTTVAAANNWANVLSVQVHLLLVGGAKNDTNSNVNTTAQTYTFNGATTTASGNDRRLYQEAVATVAIRNRL